jgi:FG-GAP-like repeat
VGALAALATLGVAIASVPATVVPAEEAEAAPTQAQAPTAQLLTGDFDGDGRVDILWYGPGGNPDHHWYGRANGQFGGRPIAINGTYQPIVGDFDGDRRSDILWYAPGAPDVVYYGTSGHGFVGKATAVGGTYRPFTGDFDGDGRTDIFWYGPGSARDSVWYGAPGRTFAGKSISIGGTYQPLIGDYDGDRRSDIFWYGPGTAADVVYYGTASRSFAGKVIPIGGTYQPLIGDYDGDRRSDIFWYRPGTATDVIYFGTASRSFAGKGTAVSGTYTPTVGDYDGGGRADVFWWVPGTGDDGVWFGTAARSFVKRPTAIDLAYERPLPLQPQRLVDSYVPFGYIAHAAGGYDGRTYTNSLDAFQHNYNRGFRVFEIDFVVLADGTVLAAHDGLEHYYGLAKPFAEATWAEVRGHKFDGKYTIMRSDEVVQLLRDHPDIYVILDTKYRHDYIFRRFVGQTGGSHALMDRVLPHIKDQAELDLYRNTWPLRNYMIALYRSQFAGDMDDPELVSFVRNNRSPGVMMWYRDRDPSLTLAQNHVQGRRFTPQFAQQVQAAGAVAAVHTIRLASDVPRYESLAVGVYSDEPFAVGVQVAAEPEKPLVDPVFPPGVVPA